MTIKIGVKKQGWRKINRYFGTISLSGSWKDVVKTADSKYLLGRRLMNKPMPKVVGKTLMLQYNYGGAFFGGIRLSRVSPVLLVDALYASKFYYGQLSRNIPPRE